MKVSYRMWGFGMYLMHLVDYLTRRKYNKSKTREVRQRQLIDRKQCSICGKDFSGEIQLDDHIKKKHHDMI